jgi:hypothetical protein
VTWTPGIALPDRQAASGSFLGLAEAIDGLQRVSTVTKFIQPEVLKKPPLVQGKTGLAPRRIAPFSEAARQTKDAGKNKVSSFGFC